MNYVIQRNGLNFCVDYYVELLGVLCILCENQEAIYWAGETECNEAYVSEVKEYFSTSQSAKLTQTLQKFSKEYWFNYDAPVCLMLMLSNDQPIDKDALFSERKVIPDILFEEFLADLRTFEESSNFANFYEQHLPMYAKIIERFTDDYAQYNSHDFLLPFLNEKPDVEFYINFMVGITNANYGATIGKKVYCNICPYFETRYAPMPDYSYEPIYYSTLVLHEFAHSFVNYAVAQYRHIISQIDIEPYTQVLYENGYGESLETLISETVIRTLECLYVKENFPQWYEPFVAEYVAEGYFKLREMIDKIDKPVNYTQLVNLFV